MTARAHDRRCLAAAAAEDCGSDAADAVSGSDATARRADAVASATTIRCRGVVPDDALVALCEAHLAAAGEWSAEHYGEADVLPSPCRLCGSRAGVRFASGWICGVCEWRFGDVPDDELPPPRVDVVYYLRYGDRVKIGTSMNPRVRLASLWHDELLAFERGGRSLERRRHSQFAADRYPGTEWFRHSDALAAHIGAVAAGADDPWEVHARWLSEAIALRG